MSTSRQEAAPNVKEQWIVVMSRSQKRKLKLAELEAEMNREYYGDNYDEQCSFCGRKMWDCGGDHGDEMRDILRESRRHRRRC